MSYIPITPFRRTIDAVLLKHQKGRGQTPAPAVTDKWKILRELATARKVYALSDRDITVLQALLSFHKTTLLDVANDLVVFPSNKSICERLNGMPSSTMRRHIAHLVDTGIISRRDSPNGKRYVRRYGPERVAYGFDLAPFVRRYDEFAKAASAIRTAQLKHKHLRETVSLMRRDLASLVTFGQLDQPNLPVWDRLSDLVVLTSRNLRRRLTDGELSALQSSLADAICETNRQLGTGETPELSISDNRIEHHHQNSKEESYKEENETSSQTSKPEVALSNMQVPLKLVVTACKEIQVYSSKPITDWQSLISASEDIRPMMGIRESTWHDAIKYMGRNAASSVVAAMLEKFDGIRSPDAYLKHLKRKAQQGTFAVSPMILAAMRPAVA